MTHPARGIRHTHRVVRRESLGPRDADEPHRVTPAPPSAPPPIDAYMLVGLWKRARMAGDMASARRALEVLEGLAERPKRRTEGEHDEQYG
jgi:hypothetical protein